MITVTKRKLDGGYSSWSAECVAVDVHGGWYFCPQGAVHTAADGPSFTLPCNGVQLVAPGSDWVAWWWAQPRWVSIDVCRPVVVTSQCIDYVDLEVDLAWSPGGPAHVVDEDELAAEVVAGHVEPPEAQQVLALAASLQQRLQGGDPLFAEVGWRYLSALG